MRSATTRFGRYRWPAAVLVCWLLLAAGPGSGARAADPPLAHWRFALEETPGSVQHEYALRFKELVEQRSGGDIRVSIYTYGELGTSDQVTELLRMGTVQFAMASPGHLGTLMPEIQVLLLHYLFSDDEVVNRDVLGEPEVLAAFDELYAEKGFRLLSIYQEGWMVWTTNRPVREPADFQGMKIRVMTSPMLLAAYNAYGASPTPLPYGEVYSALQLNMIDAQVNPVFAIEEMSFYEVVDYMVFGDHLPFITTAVTNRDFYRQLGRERRVMVDAVIGELHGYIFDLQRDYNEKRLQIIKDNAPELEIIRLGEAERQRFRQVAAGVEDDYLELAGPRGGLLLEMLKRRIRAAESRAGAGGSRRRPGPGQTRLGPGAGVDQ